MVFYIEEKGGIDCHSNPIAEIELYWKEEIFSHCDRKYWLECHFFAFTTGFINFCKNRLGQMSDGEIKELQKDFKVLQEIRGWLFEVYNAAGKLKASSEEFDRDIYNGAYEHIAKTVKDFCTKYNLNVNID